MPSVTRPPHARLLPFVETLWASAPAGSTPVVERMLPARAAHIVIRVDDDPVEIVSDGASGESHVLGAAVVGGPRTTAYVRRGPLKGRTVGAVLRPGATAVVLDAGGLDLAGRHTALRESWGPTVDGLRERLAATSTLAALVDVLEAALVDRLRRPRALHPAVAAALERLPVEPVADVVRATGYSHRRFAELFTGATGLAPKRYSRLARFERTLGTWAAAPSASLASLAHAAGYSDQAHLTREFVEFAGLTPGCYRRSATVGSRHVPVVAGPGNVNFVQDGRAVRGRGSAP